jgi:uronate dehydrogenase
MTDTSSGTKRVLVTGAGGRVGRAICPLLAARYSLRLMYRAGEPALPDVAPPHEIVAGELSDLASVRAAVRGSEVVLHLAASVSMHVPWQDALEVNVKGTWHVLEAMRLEGVRRIVYASSNHATGGWELEGVACDAGTALRGDSHYGASKAMGEVLARLYVDQFGMSAICLRIGSFRPEPEDVRQLSTWLSPRDMAQLVSRSIDSPLRWGVYYAISGNTRRYWDIDAAVAQLGYAPEDDGERHAPRFRTSVSCDSGKT